MREVDFRYLQSALESLSSSTDLVLERGRVRAVLSRQASPYASRRQVRFDLALQPLGDDVLLAANYRKILVVGRTEDDVQRATEAVGRDGRPFEDSQLRSEERRVGKECRDRGAPHPERKKGGK